MITISLCMIVKNEEAVLERLLRTMSTVADQIVIMDTGSTDRTKEIAARYTDEVYDFPWTDDFAAARNAVCQKAVTDYWMWMDADDVMELEQAACLKKLKETLDPSVDVVMMKYLTGFDENWRTSFSYYRERLFKESQGFQWQGRVHEVVTSAGNILYTDIEIQHRKEGAGDKEPQPSDIRNHAGARETSGTQDTSFYYARSCITTNAMKMLYGCSGHFCRNRWMGGKQDRRLSPSGSVRGASGTYGKGRGTFKKFLM